MANTPLVAVVTGAADGIGWATAQKLAASGYRIALLDLRAEAAQSRAAELGPDHLGLGCDVTQPDSVDAAIAAARALGRIAVLVNNAGIGDQTGPTVAQDVAAFDRVLDVHLRGTFLVSQAVAKTMLQGRGHRAIVNLGSIASSTGLPARNAYSAAKAGVIGMTRAMASEWARDGIRVNAIAPGFIVTQQSAKSRTDPAHVAAVSLRTPMGRWGQPDDIAGPALFLASNAAAFMTGTCLAIDGGYSIA